MNTDDYEEANPVDFQFSFIMFQWLQNFAVIFLIWYTWITLKREDDYDTGKFSRTDMSRGSRRGSGTYIHTYIHTYTRTRMSHTHIHT